MSDSKTPQPPSDLEQANGTVDASDSVETADTEPAQQVKEAKRPMSEQTKKRVAIGGSAVAVVIAAMLLITQIVIPASEQSAAQKSFDAASSQLDAGNYKDAAISFNDTAKMPGAGDIQVQCMEKVVECGVKMIESKQYDDAMEVFATLPEDTSNEKVQQYVSFCKGMNAFIKKDYREAEDYLEQAEGVFDTSSTLGETRKIIAYQEGQMSYKSGNYSDARSSFKAAGNYKNAQTMALKCKNISKLQDANELFREGQLYSAQKAYGKLPKNFKFKGVSVKKRLATLKKFSKFVNICGTYESTSQKQKVTQIWDYDGRSSWWDNTADGGNTVSITCKIKGNKVKVDVSWSIYRYTSYSSVAVGLDMGSEYGHAKKTFSSLPSSFGVGNHATISFPKNKRVKISYNFRNPNESVNFTYVYSATANYKMKSHRTN